MTAELYNFRKPPRLTPDTEGWVRAWLRTASALTVNRLKKQLPWPVEQSLSAMETVRAADALGALPETTFSYRVKGPGKAASLLILPRPLALALIGGLLGENVADLPADRDLSPVEEALGEYLLGDLLLAPVRETWPRPEPAALALDAREPNARFSRLFPGSAILVELTFTLKAFFGEPTWTWLMPLSALTDPAGDGTHKPPAVDAVALRARLEAMVREMSVPLTVTLGSAQVPLAQISRLREGDLLILDQRVGDPLPADVSGARKFHGWPGRVGGRQAFQIESRLEG